MPSLFNRYPLSTFLSNRYAELQKYVDTLSPVILERELDILLKEIEDKYYLEVPILSEKDEDIEFSHSEVPVTNSDFGRKVLSKATKYTFFIPFLGNEELLAHEPSSSNTLKPEIEKIEQRKIVLSIIKTNPDEKEIKDELERVIKNIKSFLSSVDSEVQSFGFGTLGDNSDIRGFNAMVSATAKCALEKRQTKLQKDKDVALNLGYPLKRKELILPDYTSVPLQRKIQAFSVQQYRSEPLLLDKDYEDILFLLSNMSIVMERCPEAFIRINEESLRMHFLVQLNGLYQGQAIGETFNAEGKTDILIRVDNRNIFIAECKFWDGEKTLTNAINQLLSYLSWRDTKVALIMFNRTPNFSSVLKKISPIVEKHPNYKSTSKPQSESSFRFVFHQNGDRERELILTVLAFDVPVLPASQ